MRCSVKLGIAQQREVSPGVWEETITEHDAIGDMVQRTEVDSTADRILPATTTTTSISVLARGIGITDNSTVRYVMFLGKRWLISSVVSQPPRCIFYIGEEYHGPTP